MDWAILKDGPSYRSAQSFDPRHLLAVGETKIVGLGAAGQGPAEESGRIARLAEQLNAEALSHCPRFAHLILPCWRTRKRGLDDAALEAIDGFVFAGIREQFGIDATRQHVQVITGWLGSGIETEEFALLQLLLRAPGERWEAVEPPMQHQLSWYLTAAESRDPVHA